MSDRDKLDALAEAMRRERFGAIRPLWADLRDDTRKAWAGSALVLTRILDELGFEITRKQES